MFDNIYEAYYIQSQKINKGDIWNVGTAEIIELRVLQDIAISKRHVSTHLALLSTEMVDSQRIYLSKLKCASSFGYSK